MTHSGQPTEHTITDHWQTLRKIVLQWLLVISSFGLACLLMFIHVFAPENLDRVFVSYVGLAIVSVGWLMLRAGYERFAVHILIGGVWALFFIAPIIGSGVYTVTYTSHVLVIMLSGVFYTRRVTALITAISVSFGGILVVLADVGTVDTPQNTPLSPLITWVGLSIIFIITASLILAIQGTARGIIGQIERDGRFYRTIISDQTEFIVRWKPDGRRTFVNAIRLS